MNPKISDIEKRLKEKILPDLKKSRGGFDEVHTLEVVDWMKQIISHNPELKLDETVLIIAAYAHDWGYSEIFKDGQVMNFEIIENAKKLHMKLGAKKIEKLLHDDIFSFLTDEQKVRCIHLVAVHDKKFEIKDVDEIILMEADVLSGLNVSTKKPVLDAKSNIKFMESMLNIRIPKFITEFSRNEARKLIQMREEYYNNQSEKNA
ncbi:MAG: HD domain-containing protein [Leadbetterella sp.]|nr:HD domain-containing protein [Leadbetterella sp.]